MSVYLSLSSCVYVYVHVTGFLCSSLNLFFVVSVSVGVFLLLSIPFLLLVSIVDCFVVKGRAFVAGST